MSTDFVEFADVRFSYNSSVEPVVDGLTVDFHTGWTGIVGANGAGKTTILHLCVGLLEPDRGIVKRPDVTAYCPQRTDDPPERFTDFLDDWGSEGSRLRGILGIEYDWYDRWESLSHGERKRAQIAAALWRDPELLAVDEPTNHLDSDARLMLLQALVGYRGVGLIVSHDRELLDTLCSGCLFVEESRAVMRSGGVSAGLEQQERERRAARNRYREAEEELARVEAEASRRRALAASQQKRRSKRGIPIGDNDARYKKNLARISGKDGTGGRLLRQMDGRIRQVRERMSGIETVKEHKRGITFGGERSRSDAIVRTGAAALPLGFARKLEIPELMILPADRIALTGPNGTGKSTLVRHLVGMLPAPGSGVVYIPQEIGVEATRELSVEIGKLSPGELGEVLSTVSRLGSRPERILSSALFSPGEARKILLALGISRNPKLIVMDEPTNHMDLPSIRCLEEALGAVECALLLVSHDRMFLDALTKITWDISAHGDESRLTVYR